MAYLVKDIARAVDPSPGLSSSLRDIAALQKKLAPGPRQRKLQNDEIVERVLS